MNTDSKLPQLNIESLDIKSRIAGTLKLLPNSPQFLESISEEIATLFNFFKDKLDKNWLMEFCTIDKTYERLFELIILKQFKYSEEVKIEKYQLETNSKPDFCISYKGANFVAEATSVGMPIDPASEMQKIAKIFEKSKEFSSGDYDKKKLVNEYKSRLTQAIIKKSKYKELIQKKSIGFILFISFAKIPFVIKPNVYHLVHALYGCGDFTYLINPVSKQCVDMYYQYQAEFDKKSAVRISNQCLLDQQNKWISAIVISPQDSFMLLDFAVKQQQAVWPYNHKNDFIVIHNPYAIIPLEKGILPVSTEIDYDIVDSKIVQHGANIFPGYAIW